LFLLPKPDNYRVRDWTLPIFPGIWIFLFSTHPSNYFSSNRIPIERQHRPTMFYPSLSKVYVHIIFSTKNRQNLIDGSIEASLYEYLVGICKGLECNPVKVGGHKDERYVWD